MNEEVLGKLKRFRCSTRDAAYAASLAHWIGEVHDLVFPEKEAFIRFDLQSARQASWVGYSDRKLHPAEDAYSITVPGLYRALSDYQRTWDPQPSVETTFLAIAMHEVRHRLQFERPELRLFAPRTCSTLGLREIAEKVGRRRRWILGFLREEAFHLRLAKEIANNGMEFDACFVEYLALSNTPAGDDIRRMATSEPPPLSP